MKDKIDLSDNPPVTAERAKKGWIRLPDGSRIVPVQIDAATFRWFQLQGRDCSEQVEVILRNYVTSQREHQIALTAPAGDASGNQTT